MTIKLLLATLGTLALLSAGAAYAQTTPAPKATKTEKTAKPAAKPRTAKSIECSKLADEKGLHGKARRKFRSECRKG